MDFSSLLWKKWIPFSTNFFPKAEFQKLKVVLEAVEVTI